MFVQEESINLGEVATRLMAEWRGYQASLEDAALFNAPGECMNLVHDAYSERIKRVWLQECSRLNVTPAMLEAEFEARLSGHYLYVSDLGYVISDATDCDRCGAAGFVGSGCPECGRVYDLRTNKTTWR